MQSNTTSRDASHDGVLHMVSFTALFLIFLLTAFTNWEQSAWITVGAVFAVLIFGLPHGAYDLQLIASRLNAGDAGISVRSATGILALYILCAMGAALLWLFQPSIALILFIVMAGIHFGEDWEMLEPGLLRAMAGFSPLATIAVSSPEDAFTLFAALSDPWTGNMLVKGIMMASPVILLVTMVAHIISWKNGNQWWCLSQLTALVICVIAPPVLAFAAFFILFHSPIHLVRTRQLLAQWQWTKFVGYGLGISIVATLMMLLFSSVAFERLTPSLETVLFMFRLLAIVTVPHLVMHSATTQQMHLLLHQRQRSLALSRPN
jgi:beta-carotene 15,15'-dioxygenase